MHEGRNMNTYVKEVFNRASRAAAGLRLRHALVVLALLFNLVPLTEAAGIAHAAPLAAVSNPPAHGHSIIVFPQRDFVSADGYADGDLVVVYVIEPDGTTWSTDPANPISPQGGIVEVNHPGGACWFGTTPDIRPGDIVQIDVVDGPNTGIADATTVMNITAKRPVQTAPDTVVVHGTAQDSFTAVPGNPLPIAEIEHRIVAPGNLFDLNGRRTLRATSVAGSDGTLAYDAPGSINWTATYSGLSPADVTLALGAESRGMWLGRAVAPALETTVYEIGALTVGGPAAPCTAPLEVRPPPPGSELIPPSTPTNLTGTFDHINNVTLNWTASTDNVGVTAYGIYRNGEAVFTVSNPDGSAPAPTTFVESNLPPGNYSFEVRAFDEVGNGSQLSNATQTFTAVQRVDINNFPVNDPPLLPINIIAFPSRDFISPSGFEDSDVVSVQLLRRNSSGQTVVVSSADGIQPIDGFAEVNHPGGACCAGVTPEMRAGDIVRTIAYNPAKVTPANPDGIRTIDQTTIAGVTAFRPEIVQPDDPNTPENDGIVEIHGTALGADGLPLPIDQIEQRMIATHGVGLWDFNGRRAMRAAANADGTLNYDTVNNPMGVNWTARYSGLDAADVARMAVADTRIHWLGRNPVALNEATIFENADGNPPGPAGPGCTRPLEAADTTKPSTPGAFALVKSSPGPNQVTVSWTASTDDWYVAGYRVFVDGIAVANTGPMATSYVLTPAPGQHTYAVAAYDTASPRGAGADIISQIAAGFGHLYGNVSPLSASVTATQDDVTAPTVPTDLVAKASVGKATLTWSAATDDVAVDKYGVYRDGVLVATTSNPTYTDNGLAVGNYVYTVDAVDRAGNRSAQSAPTTANVSEVPDTTAPTAPASLAASTSPDIHGRNVAISWTAATDAVGVTGYNIYRKRVLSPDTGAWALIASVNGTTLAFTDVNLATGTYSYTVEAFDSAGNLSDRSPAAGAVVANDPPVGPHSVIVFPARDFISATGFTPNAVYHFSLIRGGLTVLSASLPADTTGLIEVNHPGGTCWTVNTPDIRPGDVVRITDDATGIADQTTVADVTADRPIALNANTVIVHGTAKDAVGQPLPVDQVESRLITSSANSFDVNGRRVLRSGVDGTLTYDGPGSTKWTATYTGLSVNDVLRAVGGKSPTGTVFVGAESRAHWLGRFPLALTEATIFENGPGVVGGPSAPCTAPAETPVAAASFTPTRLTLASTKFLPSPASTSAAQTVTFSNGGGVAMTINNIYVAGLNPGDFARSGGTCPTNLPGQLLAGASCTVNITFKPTALGLRQANVSLSGNAANTTDLTVPLTAFGIDITDPAVGVSPTTKNFGTVNGGASASQVFTVTNTGLDPTGIPLTISAVSITGTNAADFTVTSQTCTAAPLAQGDPGGSCTVTVQFKPGARTARAASLTLTHNAAGPTRATSTTVALSGTGGTGSVLAFASNPVQFGTVNRNTTKDQTISVKNNGNATATLNLASFAATGTGYTVLSTTCAGLAANGSCNVVVRFTAPNTVATFNGTLSVTASNGLPTTVTASLAATTK